MGRNSTPGAPCMVRPPVYLVGDAEMRKAPEPTKVQGLSPNQEPTGASVLPAQHLGNKPARQDCRLPAGCTAYPAEFLSKRAAAKYVELVRKAARIGATVDLIVGPYRRRPDYLVRIGNVSRRLAEVEAASRWLETLQDGEP